MNYPDPDCDEPQDPKRSDGPTDEESAVDLLDPLTFQQRFPDLFRKVYPANVKFRGVTPIIPNEYILVDDEPKLRFMQQKGKYRLEVVVGDLRDPVVTVAKYRFCGGKALVLLTATEDLDPLYALPLLGKIRAISLDGHPNGTIRPGGKGTAGDGQDGETNQIGRGQDGETNQIGRGQDGETNQIGRGQGYPNCVGYNHPGLTSETDGFTFDGQLNVPNSCLKVAILDSGVKFRAQEPTEGSAGRTCREVLTGWDFVGDRSHPDGDSWPNDEQTNFHGTRVASIIRKLCPQATLIPVRIANAENACTLYDVLCGLEYAAQQRVQLINASWIFPTTQGTFIPLLQASLRRLAFRGIIMVCSGGNVGKVAPADLDALPHIGESKNGQYVPMLSPACSSETLENLITVTSVAEVPDEDEDEGSDGNPVLKRVVCELRSKRFVTVGVQVNDPHPDEDKHFGTFDIPHFNPFRGTSFAAPYVSGHIAKAMHDRLDLSSRRDILRAIGAKRDRRLRKHIRQGYWMKA